MFRIHLQKTRYSNSSESRQSEDVRSHLGRVQSGIRWSGQWKLLDFTITQSSPATRDCVLICWENLTRKTKTRLAALLESNKVPIIILFQFSHYRFAYKRYFVLNTNSRTRGHAFELFKTHSTGVRATFFCERVVNPWNNLPSNTDFSSLSPFKRSFSAFTLWTVWNVTDFYCVCIILMFIFTAIAVVQ